MDDTRLSLLFAPECHVCGRQAVRLEVVPPGQLPLIWSEWSPQLQQAFHEWHNPKQYRLIYEGICAGNGLGHDVGEQEARDIVREIVPILRIDAIRKRWYDELGYCPRCGAFYCYEHWSPSAGGYGYCPQGHGKSLDPHWSPGD